MGSGTVRYADLHMHFLRWEGGQSGNKFLDGIDGADGVQFWCPACEGKTYFDFPIAHPIRIWSPSVPDGIDPGPGRWEMIGTGPEDLTLVSGSSSIYFEGHCGAHFFVRNGEVTMA